jgi:hypothetical protein
MSEEDTICILHALNKTAIICQHLNLTDRLGFNVPYDLDNDLEAWCDKCEKILQEEGGWTERAIEYANLRVCCEFCFEKIKNLNYNN